MTEPGLQIFSEGQEIGGGGGQQLFRTIEVWCAMVYSISKSYVSRILPLPKKVGN